MEQIKEHDYSLTIFVAGHKSSGKSSLINQFVKESKNSAPTSKNKIILINQKKVKLDIEEQPEHADEMSQEWLRGKKITGLVLVYDPLNQESFEYIRDYHTHIAEFREKHSVVTIACIKPDSSENYTVSTDTAIEFTKEIGGHFIEASVATRKNINKIFETIAFDYNVHLLSVLELFAVGKEQDCLTYIKKTDFVWNHLLDELMLLANERNDQHYFISAKLRGIEAEINFLQRRILAYKNSPIISMRYSGDIAKSIEILKALKQRLDNILPHFLSIKFSAILISKPIPKQIEALPSTPIETIISDKPQPKIEQEAKSKRRISAFCGENHISGSDFDKTCKEIDTVLNSIKPGEDPIRYISVLMQHRTLLESSPQKDSSKCKKYLLKIESQLSSETEKQESKTARTLFFNSRGSESSKVEFSAAEIDPISKQPFSKIEKIVCISSGYSFDEKELINWYEKNPAARIAQICPITSKKIAWDSENNLPLMFENLTFKHGINGAQKVAVAIGSLRPQQSVSE